jgi:hypothetical protein
VPWSGRHDDPRYMPPRSAHVAPCPRRLARAGETGRRPGVGRDTVPAGAPCAHEPTLAAGKESAGRDGVRHDGLARQ